MKPGLLAALAGALLVYFVWTRTASAADAADSGDAGGEGGSAPDDGEDPTPMAPTRPTVYQGAYAWTADLVIDADGAPGAYAPHGGLDALANAGHPGRWWGLVTDDGTPAGTPVVADDGNYVSSTALVDRAYGRTDPRRYVDASTICYLAVGRDVLSAMGAQLGDLAWCTNPRTGKSAGAIVADIAPRGRFHEGSIALAEALGGSGNPRSGGLAEVQYVVFPGTAAGWPRSDYQSAAEAAFWAWGGTDALAHALSPGGS